MAESFRHLVVVADDEPEIFIVLEKYLNDWGWRAAWAKDKASLLGLLAVEQPCLLLLDLFFGSHNGLEIFPELQTQHTDMIIALLTGNGTIDNAVAAIKLGAYDYLTKPPNFQRLRVILDHSTEKQVRHRRIETQKGLMHTQASSRHLLGDSVALREVRAAVSRIAPTDATVLILGASGTGKELVAQALHEQSPRRHGAFVVVNTTALPHELVESTLFGHEKGAFTGAATTRIGSFEKAEGGTLFLDEIGDMDLRAQSKLLRFLQERTFERVGSSQTRTSNVRVVAATNRDLQTAIQKGQFREDLYYRLNVVPVKVPSLRECRADIPLLATRFLERAALRHDKQLVGFSPSALSILMDYSWPGNVRQLENLVERLAILTRGVEVGCDDIPAEIRGDCTSQTVQPFSRVIPAAPRQIEELERGAILDALTRTQSNVRLAARILGRSQATIYRKIKCYGLELKENRRAVVEFSKTAEKV